MFNFTNEQNNYVSEKLFKKIDLYVIYFWAGVVCGISFFVSSNDLSQYDMMML